MSRQTAEITIRDYGTITVQLDPVITDDPEINELRQQIELIQGASHPFVLEEFLAGELTPVFFGSAINNFGVREVLDALVDLALERPETVELVVTGRGASGTLMAVADLVTEMREVKHYYEEGVIARRGIEF